MTYTMKKMKRYIAFILSVIISMCVMQVSGINVLSVKAETLGDFTVSGDVGGYSYSSLSQRLCKPLN